MKVVLIGATGLVGESLLQLLVQSKEINNIETISRRKINIQSSKIKENVFPNLSSDDLKALSFDADIYICALGTTIKTAKTKDRFKEVDYDLVISFAELAKKNKNSSFFVISAKGANANSMFFYNKVKGEMENSLIEMSFKSLSIYRPSLLIGERKEERTGEKLAIKLYQTLGPVIPQKTKKLIGTQVSSLASKILNDIQEQKEGTFFIESEKI